MNGKRLQPAIVLHELGARRRTATWTSVDLCLAGVAEPIELKEVARRFNAVLVVDIDAGDVNDALRQLFDASAAGADEVRVMTIVRHQVVGGSSGARKRWPSDPQAHQSVERAKDRCAANATAKSVNLMENFSRCQVALGMSKHFDDGTSRGRDPECRLSESRQGRRDRLSG